MSGFASGFEAGYGLVSRDMAQRRRDKLARERLAADEKRNQDLAQYRSDSLGLQQERVEIERDRQRGIERDRMRQRANQASALVNESDEILRQTRLDREAAARQKRLDEISAESNAALTRERTLRGDVAALELRQAELQQAHQTLVSGLSGNGDPQAVLDALALTQGTPYHPAFYFGPETSRRLRTATDFASGKRQDFQSEDFLDVVDFALAADTSLMRGMPNARGGTIADMRVIGVEPVGGEDGVPQGLQVKVRVKQESGETYNTYLTRGRATGPGAERAVIPVDHLLQSVAGHAYQASAIQDPEARDQLRTWIIQSDPKGAEDAIRAADRAYESDREAWNEDKSNFGKDFPISRQEYIDTALQRRFGAAAGPVETPVPTSDHPIYKTPQDIGEALRSGAISRADAEALAAELFPNYSGD